MEAFGEHARKNTKVMHEYIWLCNFVTVFDAFIYRRYAQSSPSVQSSWD